MTPRRLIAAVLLMSGTFASCNGNDDPAPISDSDSDGLATSWTADKSECEDISYNTPLTVETQDPAEVPYLEQVVACVSDEQYGPVWLHNTGDTVWQFNAVATAHADFEYSTPQSEFFSALYADGESLLRPGDKVVVDAPLPSIEWNLDRVRSAAWLGQEQALDLTERLSRSAVEQSLAGGNSAAREVIVSCTFAAQDGFSLVESDPEITAEDAAEALGFAGSATGCASKFESAWQTRLEPTSAWLETAEKRLTFLERAGKLLSLAPKIGG